MGICYICLEEITKDFLSLQCNHNFHRKCLKQIRNLTCPTCRQPIHAIDKNIIKKITTNQNKDILYKKTEEELAITLLQLEEYEQYIDTIEINLKTQLPK